jgi:hypothetical protein
MDYGGAQVCCRLSFSCCFPTTGPFTLSLHVKSWVTHTPRNLGHCDGSYYQLPYVLAGEREVLQSPSHHLSCCHICRAVRWPDNIGRPSKRQRLLRLKTSLLLKVLLCQLPEAASE